jgi:hypothetical protein
VSKSIRQAVFANCPSISTPFAEIEKGIGPGEQIEVTISANNAEKTLLKRPATSVLHALQRHLKGSEYTVVQRAVKDEPWPRLYIQLRDGREESKR